MSAWPGAYVRGALRAMQVRHARVCPDSQIPHRCAGSASRYAGKTRTCPPCPAHRCIKRFALCRRDSHVSARPRTVVREAAASRNSGETLTCLPGPVQMCGQRFALCERDMHVSAWPGTYVREALRAMQARHARVCPAPHRCAGRAPLYAGETRTCLPCPVHMCGMSLAICRRDTHVSSLPHT